MVKKSSAVNTVTRRCLWLSIAFFIVSLAFIRIGNYTNGVISTNLKSKLNYEVSIYYSYNIVNFELLLSRSLSRSTTFRYTSTGN